MKILIVDDHPFIIQAYKNALEKYSQQGYEFEVIQANNCKSGYENIVESKIPFNVAFFDISMPEYAEKGIYSGEDYELLFTIALDDFDKIKANPNFTVIGHLTHKNEGIHLITRANTKIPLKARGWDALSEE